MLDHIASRRTAAVEESMLYVQVRKDKEAVDPLQHMPRGG
jgi:hypothetical protein